MADKPKKPNATLNMWLFVGLILVILFLIQLLQGRHHHDELPQADWSEFHGGVADGSLTGVAIIAEGPGQFVRVHFTASAGATGQWKETTGYVTPDLLGALRTNRIPHTFHEHEHHAPTIWEVLWGWVPFVLVAVFLLVVFVSLLARNGPNVQTMMLPPVRDLPDDDTPTTFDDVIGCGEAKTVLRDALAAVTGGTPGRRVLLSGPTGCGKTMLIRAVATECQAAGVRFRYLIGGDFVEVFVGVGAARVKRLFQEAKKGEPTVIVIDAIDALAKRREPKTGSLDGEEREQTLSQLLEALDGFAPPAAHTGVILTTNRVDLLDEALVRPGRLDRVVAVGPPDAAAREQLLRRHGVADETVVAHATAQSADWSAAAVVALAQAAVKQAAGVAVTAAHIDAAVEEGFGQLASAQDATTN